MRITSSHVQGDVASGLEESSVDLQTGIHVVVLVAAHALAYVVVHRNAVPYHTVLFHIILGQRVVHIGIGILVEGYVVPQALVVG